GKCHRRPLAQQQGLAERRGGGVMQDLVSVLGLGGYGVALLAAVYALLPKKGSLENQMIDQLQESDKGKEERIGSLESRVDRLEDLLIWYRRRDVAWDRYVSII